MDSVSVPHATQHADLNDAVEALEAKVGADSSAVTSSHDYKIAQLEAISHGKILQVVSTTKTDTFTASLAQGAFTSVTGLSAVITPSDTSSKVLVFVTVSGSNTTSDLAHLTLRVLRGATEIGSGDAASTRSTVMSAQRFNYAEAGNIVNATGSYVDSPVTTSATTYSVSIGSLQSGTHTVAVNRSANDTDSASFARSSSTITLMEVSA
jgi:hypothetical protein